LTDFKPALKGTLESQTEADGIVATPAEATAMIRNDRIITPARMSAVLAGVPTSSGAFSGAGCTMIFEGDSLTAGYLLPNPATQNFGAQFFTMQFNFGAKAYYNFAVSGNRMADVAARYNANVKPHRPASFGGDGGLRSYLYVTIGTNNFVDGMAAATLLSEISAYVSTARADGFTVVWGTITPSTYFGLLGTEESRMTVNAAIRRNQINANFVWDMESILQNSRDPLIFPDGGHYSLAACTMLAKALNLGMMNGQFPVSASFGISKNGHSLDGAFECAGQGNYDFSAAAFLTIKDLAPYKRVRLTGTIWPSTQAKLFCQISSNNGVSSLTSGYISQFTASAGSGVVSLLQSSSSSWEFSAQSVVGSNVLNEMHFECTFNRFNEVQRTGATMVLGLENTFAIGTSSGFLRQNDAVACNAILIGSLAGTVSGSIMVEGSRS